MRSNGNVGAYDERELVDAGLPCTFRACLKCSPLRMKYSMRCRTSSQGGPNLRFRKMSFTSGGAMEDGGKNSYSFSRCIHARHTLITTWHECPVPTTTQITTALRAQFICRMSLLMFDSRLPKSPPCTKCLNFRVLHPPLGFDNLKGQRKLDAYHITR